MYSWFYWPSQMVEPYPLTEDVLEAQAAGGFLAAPVAHFQTNLLLRELSGAGTAAITTAIHDAPATCKVIIVSLRGAVAV